MSNEALKEIPRDKIIEAAKAFERVRISVRRQDGRGHWGGLAGNIMMSTTQLLEIEQLCVEWAGGGRFQVDTFDPADNTKLVVPRFEFFMEGASRPYTGPGAQPRQTALGTAPEYVAPGGRPFVAPDPRTEGAGVRVRDLARHTSDEIALRHAGDMDRVHERERQRWEAERREHKTQIGALEKKVEELTNRIIEQDRAHERAQTDARFEALRAQMQSAQTAPRGPGVVEIITAVTPIATAIMQLGQTRVSSAVERQNSQEAQMVGVLKEALIARNQPGNGAEMIKQAVPLLTALGTIFGPVIGNIIKARSPEAQMKLMQTLGEMIMVQTSQSADMLRQAAEQSGSTPGWLQLIDTVAGSIERWAGALQTNLRAQAGGPEQTPIRAEVIDRTEQARARMNGVPASPQMTQETQPEPDIDPQQARFQEVMAALPPHLQTQEWANVVFFALLEQQNNIEPIAERIVGLLKHLVEFRTLPRQMAPVMDDLEQLRPLFFDLLPISDQYRDELADKTIEMLTAAVGEPAEEQGDEEEPAAPPPAAQHVAPRKPAPTPQAAAPKQRTAARSQRSAPARSRGNGNGNGGPELVTPAPHERVPGPDEPPSGPTQPPPVAH